MTLLIKRSLLLQKCLKELIGETKSVRKIHITLIRKLEQPRNGPDQVLCASSHRTWKADGIVQLDMGSSGLEATPPESVFTLMKRTAQEYPDLKALAVKRGGEWKTWDYQAYYKETCQVARAFIKLGLDRHHAVCIMGAGSPEWAISYFACVIAGGITAGIYTTNSPDACRYIAEHSNAQIAVLQDAETVEKFLQIRHHLPHLKVIVQWLGQPKSPEVMTWDELMSAGKTENNSDLEDRLKLSAVNQCCSLIYTSGTTGPPKAVMYSQDNHVYNGKVSVQRYTKSNHTSIVYLPLNHIASLQTLYMAILTQSLQYFAAPDALKGSLLPTMKELQPTAFFGVPRIWEKFTEGLKEAMSGMNSTKLAVIEGCRNVGLNYWRAIISGRKLSVIERLQYNIVERLVLSAAREQLGMKNIQHVITGTAPTDENVVKFLMSFGLCLADSYGMSECAILSLAHMEPGRYKEGSVGRIQDGMTAKLVDRGTGRPGEGEICMKGRSVFMGYLGQPEVTEQTIDGDGWLYSGDLGTIDNDGFLFITGRIKELLITAGGENIPPVIIEHRIKKLLPFISNAMVVGDRRKYLTILLTLKCEMNMETLDPLDQLSPICLSELRSLGSNSKTVRQVREEIQHNPHCSVATRIQTAIEEYNEKYSVSNCQKLQKWVILPCDFSLPGGELNSTLKIKRESVVQKYLTLINNMYN